MTGLRKIPEIKEKCALLRGPKTLSSLVKPLVCVLMKMGRKDCPGNAHHVTSFAGVSGLLIFTEQNQIKWLSTDKVIKIASLCLSLL